MFVLFLLANNLAEVMVVLIAALAKQIALTPVMLLWINLVTDGLPALALGTDEPRKGIMNGPSRERNEKILDGRSLKLVGAVSMISTAIILALFFGFLPKGVAVAQTVVFTSLVVFELMLLAIIKNAEGSSLFANKWIIGAFSGSMALQLLVLYSPAAKLFGVVPLGLGEWAGIIA